MKKNTKYILLGLAVLGGAWYFMKSKQKKGTVTVPAPESITQEQFEQTEQPSPLKALVDVVKKVAKPNPAKKMQRQEARAAKKETRKAKRLGEISVLI
jgi:LPXTG-motif cell wall-anchored protein